MEGCDGALQHCIAQQPDGASVSLCAAIEQRDLLDEELVDAIDKEMDAGTFERLKVWVFSL